MRAVWCLLAVSLAVVSGKVLDTLVIVSPERVPGIVQASSKCIEEMNLDKDTMQKFFSWQLGDSESTRKYMYCLGVKSGYIADDGSMVKKEVLGLAGSHGDNIDGVIDECNNLKYSDKYEAVFKIVMCFHEKSKLEFKV